MKIKSKIKRIAEKYIRALIVSAGIFVLAGIFMLVGRNFVLVWFLDESTLDLLGENYAISFNMAYAPLQHIQKFVYILNEASPNQNETILTLFKDSTYFSDVSHIDPEKLDTKLEPGEIFWDTIEIIDNEPFLSLIYNQGNNQYIGMKLSLKDVGLPRENIRGFAIIEDNYGNSILTALSLSDWQNYDYLKSAYENAVESNLAKLNENKAFEIDGIQYRTTEATFTIDTNEFFITLYFDDTTINEIAGIILFVLTAIFPILGLLIFVFVFLLRSDKRLFSTDTQILDSIAHGESGSLEFKSSLRWDYANDTLNKELENVILKSIAAFTNSSGGKLLIGVKDDGSILGLKNDYSTLKETTSDYFELHLRNKIDTVFGRDFSASQVRCTFYTFPSGINNGKEIAIINIKESNDPIYIMFDHKGVKTEKFFVRSGNSSRAIESLSEIARYIKKHF